MQEVLSCDCQHQAASIKKKSGEMDVCGTCSPHDDLHESRVNNGTGKVTSHLR